MSGDEKTRELIRAWSPEKRRKALENLVEFAASPDDGVSTREEADEANLRITLAQFIREERANMEVEIDFVRGEATGDHNEEAILSRLAFKLLACETVTEGDLDAMRRAIRDIKRRPGPR